MDTPEKKGRNDDLEEDDPIVEPEPKSDTADGGELESGNGNEPASEVSGMTAETTSADSGDDSATAETVEGSPERELADTRSQLKEINDKYLRLYAEFDNFRKRTAVDREELRKYANEEIVAELLSVLDHLDMAVQHSQGASAEKIVEGVQMTLKEFERLLEKFGVRIISATGQVFDPNLHHAMAQIPTEDAEPNTVVEEFRKGYQLHDKLIRAALVSVACPPENGETEGNTTESDEETTGPEPEEP